MTPSEHASRDPEIVQLEGYMDTRFAELSGKIDSLIVELRAADAARGQAISDLREDVKDVKAENAAMEAKFDEYRKSNDKEIRELRERKTVSPLQLWTVFGGAVAAMTGILASISYFNNLVQ